MRLTLYGILGVLFAFTVATFYPLRRLAVAGIIGVAEQLEWDNED